MLILMRIIFSHFQPFICINIFSEIWIVFQRGALAFFTASLKYVFGFLGLAQSQCRHGRIAAYEQDGVNTGAGSIDTWTLTGRLAHVHVQRIIRTQFQQILLDERRAAAAVVVLFSGHLKQISMNSVH